MLKKIMLLSCFFTALTASALAPVKDPSDPAPALDADSPPIPCDQLVKRMEKYSAMESSHNISMTDFLTDVGSKARSWYQDLSAYEGSTQSIPAGTFLPVKDGADKIDSITDMATDNNRLLTLERERLVAAVTTCIGKK